MRISDWSSDVCSSDLAVTSGLRRNSRPSAPTSSGSARGKPLRPAICVACAALDPVAEQLEIAVGDARDLARPVGGGREFEHAVIGIGEEIDVERLAFFR